MPTAEAACGGKGGLRLSLRHRLRGALFGEILGVGALGAFNNVLTNAAVVLATGMVGVFGTHTTAGFGLGIRGEYLQIPLVFGISGAAVPIRHGRGARCGRHHRDGRAPGGHLPEL